MSDAASPLMTVDEFLDAFRGREGKWEIENGVVYAMAGEQHDHGRVKFAAAMALRDAILRAGLPGEAVMDSVLVRITPRTAYRPDGLVYCGERLAAATREVPNPVIVVEAVSPTSEARDTHRKLVGYFTLPSVMHYLILRPGDRTALHFTRNASGVVEMRPLTAGPLRLDPPGLDLSVEDLFGEA